MTLKELERYIVQAFCNLDIKCLNELCDEASYSYCNKEDLIMDLSIRFNEMKLKGINSLNAKPSNCKYCYPKSPAYNFYNSYTNEFVIRYVIHKEADNKYELRECTNRPLAEGESLSPF